MPHPNGLQPQRKDKALAQTPNTPQKGSEGFLKKLINGPWFWPGAALVIMLAFLMASFFTQPSRQVDTNVGLQLLNDHQVKSAKIYDGDQRVELCDTEKPERSGKK